MRKLILNPGNGAREYPVGKGITIGRDAENTIQIEGQKVNDKHAKVALKGNLLFVEDLDTPFGIVVNGKKVTRWALNKGDVIEIGGTTLSYDEDDKPEPAPPKPKAKVAAKPSADQIKPAAKASTAQTKPAAKPSAPQVAPAAKAAPSKPAVKPASSAGASSISIAAEKSKPASDVKIVLPASDLANKTASRSALPAVGPASGERQSDAHSSVRIKLNAAKEVLDDVNHASDAPALRSSLSKITVKNMEPASRTSGRQPSAKSSTSTSERMKLDGAKEIERDAFSTRRSGKNQREPLVKPMSGKAKKILAIVCLVVVLIISSALLVPTISAWMAKSSEAAQKEAVLQEAIDRLKSSTVRDPEDIKIVMAKLKLADTWEKLESLLGTPSYQVKEKILLFNSNTGPYEMTGFEFKAYYMKDGYFQNPKEGDVAPIFLFMVNSSGKVSFLENHRLLCRNPDLKVNVPEPATTTTTPEPEKTGEKSAMPEEPKKSE